MMLRNALRPIWELLGLAAIGCLIALDPLDRARVKDEPRVIHIHRPRVTALLVLELRDDVREEIVPIGGGEAAENMAEDFSSGRSEADDSLRAIQREKLVIRRCGGGACRPCAFDG